MLNYKDLKSMGLKHKFRAKPVDEDDCHFGSQLEHRYYKQLKLRQLSGEVVMFLTQVPLRLPGKKKYLVDFVEFLSNGEVVFTEIKGFDTPVGKLKIAQVEELYPIKINIVRNVR